MTTTLLELILSAVLGMSLAVSNDTLGKVIERFSLTKTKFSFFGFYFGLSVLRFLTLLLLICIIVPQMGVHIPSFFLSFFIAYFVLLTYHVNESYKKGKSS